MNAAKAKRGAAGGNGGGSPTPNFIATNVGPRTVAASSAVSLPGGVEGRPTGHQGKFRHEGLPDVPTHPEELEGYLAACLDCPRLFEASRRAYGT